MLKGRVVAMGKIFEKTFDFCEVKEYKTHLESQPQAELQT